MATSKQHRVRPIGRTHRARVRLGVCLLVVLLTTGGLGGAAHPPQATPTTNLGDGRTIVMGRATWDTGWFQAEIYRALLIELGYRVERPRTYENDEFFAELAAGDVDFWANGWFPLFDPYLSGSAGENVVVAGSQVRGGALQGYLVDRRSADDLAIKTLADFTRRDVAAHFDRDSDGLADLVGCEIGWACADIIEHHLDAYELRSTVTHVQGDYSPLANDAVDRFFAHDDPLLMFTWTPNWTIGRLAAGDDVVWVPVPFPSLPGELADVLDRTLVPDVPGCAASPCSMGFPANDIQAVANADFLSNHPAVHELLVHVEIPFDDIVAQNARLIAGEDTQADIEQHAARWIAQHRDLVGAWIIAAVEAHDGSRATPAPLDPDAADRPATADRASFVVATKALAPFVIYDPSTRSYTGFSIDLWDLIADDAGFDYELYGVDSVAKLLDEVERGAADMAVSGIGITEQRERTLDFSHAYLDSGLQIMTTTDGGGGWGRNLFGTLGAVFSRQLLNIVLVLLLFLLAAAHVMWIAERRVNDDFDERYLPGVWEAFWWSAVTATTVGYGDKTPKTAVGRSIGLVWMFSGLFVLASFSASIATALAIEEVHGHIQDPSDLSGVRVGTVARSTAQEYLGAQGIASIYFDEEADAYGALRADEIDAFVYDAPVLAHYEAHGGNGDVALVGQEFQTQRYGIAMAPGLASREAINRSLLRLIESGEYEALHREWFGRN